MVEDIKDINGLIWKLEKNKICVFYHPSVIFTNIIPISVKLYQDAHYVPW